jgi:transcriptional regulator GlxA family with amidase domain
MLARRPREPIRFDFHVDFRPRRRGVLSSSLQFLHEVLAEHRDIPRSAPGSEPPAMMERLDRLLVTGLLVGQPHNFTAELRAPARPAPPAQIRRVIERIESDPAAIASATDLARIACLSLRALEEGFRRSVGVPPMSYLRDVRLARARTLLSAGDPAETSVTEIAYRCGFLHVGRFATDYRRKYGVRPSETLRSGRAEPPAVR